MNDNIYLDSRQQERKVLVIRPKKHLHKIKTHDDKQYWFGENTTPSWHLLSHLGQSVYHVGDGEGDGKAKTTA